MNVKIIFQTYVADAKSKIEFIKDGKTNVFTSKKRLHDSFIEALQINEIKIEEVVSCTIVYRQQNMSFFVACAILNAMLVLSKNIEIMHEEMK